MQPGTFHQTSFWASVLLFGEQLLTSKSVLFLKFPEFVTFMMPSKGKYMIYVPSRQNSLFPKFLSEIHQKIIHVRQCLFKHFLKIFSFVSPTDLSFSLLLLFYPSLVWRQWNPIYFPFADANCELKFFILCSCSACSFLPCYVKVTHTKRVSLIYFCL